MKYSDIAELGDNVADVIGRLASMGILLRSENGRLIYRGPKGALDQDDIAALKAFKNPIIALLGGHGVSAGDTCAELRSGSGAELVPLAFSQLAHWYAYRLQERPSYVVIGNANRWRGPLNLGALRRAVSEIVQRHDALRTRIVLCGETPMQEVRELPDYELVVDDLTRLEESSRGTELERLVSKYVLDPIDVTQFPLFRFRLIRVQDDDHVLVTMMEHIIADGMSINLLQTELFSMYQDLAQGRAASLPPVPPQFSEYARRERSAAQSWLALHYPYWKERMRGCQRTRFPADLRDEGRAGIRAVRFPIDPDVRAQAREWSRRAGTTHVMSFFVAFVALVLRWCGVPESVILFQTDGRTGTYQRTFGYLASPLYLRMALYDSDTFMDLLQRVTAEYCNAREHAEFSCFLETQMPLPGFARNVRFNWLQYEPTDVRLEPTGAQQPIDVHRLELKQQLGAQFDRDVEPAMGFAETDEEIVGFLAFRVDRFSMSLMEKAVRDYLRLLNAMLRSPEANVKRVPLE